MPWYTKNYSISCDTNIWNGVEVMAEAIMVKSGPRVERNYVFSRSKQLGLSIQKIHNYVPLSFLFEVVSSLYHYPWT